MKNKIPHSSSPSNQEIMDSYDFLANSASTQDCTGLIPSGPVNEDELTSYETVYHYLPPQIKNPKRNQKTGNICKQTQKSHKVISDLRDFCCFIFQLLLQHILLLQDFRMIHVPSVHLHLPGYLPEAQNSLSRK